MTGRSLTFSFYKSKNMLNLFNFNSSEYGNLNAEECAELMEKENPVLLDIRSPQEKADGDIPGSILINLFDPNFASQIEQLDRARVAQAFGGVELLIRFHQQVLAAVAQTGLPARPVEPKPPQRVVDQELHHIARGEELVAHG